MKVRAKWGPMIERFLTRAENLRLMIVILDLRRDPNEGDLELIEWLEDIGLPYAPVATKADKVKKSRRAARLVSIAKAIGHEDTSRLTLFSAKTGEGRLELIRVILGALEEKVGIERKKEPAG